MVVPRNDFKPDTAEWILIVAFIISVIWVYVI